MELLLIYEHFAGHKSELCHVINIFEICESLMKMYLGLSECNVHCMVNTSSNDNLHFQSI